MLSRTLSFVLLSTALVTGCVAADGSEPSPYDREFPLSDLDSLIEGAPTNDELPYEIKADREFDELNADLVAFQSPVKSQGSRGVCSIFSTAALMEHLYIKEGTLENPDFSEQFLQWSAKFEVSSFPSSSGSNAYYNLQAINRFGIVEETVWPYETQQWNTSDDEECDGEDDQPTRCYTNGHPTDEQKNSTRYTLPRGRWLNSRPLSIKEHMVSNETAVIVGLTFFYQSWNHRRSDLPVNSENWRRGIVMYPNAKDKELSLEKRAGHSIVLVGWDDTLEVEKRDEEGNVVTDADGNPVTEKGFFIFKNSWGTGSFGVDNPHGDGYGYISMEYVEEYGRAYVSDLPEVAIPVEACDDGRDNDRDGATDCDDSDCAADPVCQPDVEVLTFSSDDTPIEIPDNDAVGISSTIAVDSSATVASLKVTLDIDHTYIGDLTVVLHHGEESRTVHARTGGNQDDIKETLEVPGFNGAALAGDWKLVVTDRASYDTGTLNSWQLEVLPE